MGPALLALLIAQPEPQLPAGEAPEELDALMVIVAAGDAHAGRALRLSEAATRQLAAATGAQAGELIAILDPEAIAERRRDVAEGVAGVERAIEAFERLDLESAAGEIDLAVNALLAHVDALGPAERKSLDLGLFTIATTSLFEAQGAMADAMFVAVALMSPRFEPPADLYPSNVLSRYAEIKKHLDERPVGAVSVSSAPPGAAVVIDGVFRGSSPIVVEDLADGQHAIVLSKRGYRSFGTLTPVKADRTSRIEIDLEATEAKAAADQITPELARDAEEALAFGQMLGLSRLAILELRDGKRIEGLWLDLRERRVLGRIEPTDVPESPEVAATLIVSAIAESIHAPAPAPPPIVEAAPPVEPEGPSVLEEWWFWAIVGGVAVVAASAAAIAATTGASGRPSSQHILGF